MTVNPSKKLSSIVKSIRTVSWLKNPGLEVTHKDGATDILEASAVLSGICPIVACGKRVDIVRIHRRNRYFCPYCGGIIEADSKEAKLAFLSANAFTTMRPK